MVYVDELVPSTKAVGRFKAGTLWCHLTADRIEELQDFAKSLGLKATWFQDSLTHPHYDRYGVSCAER
jgi:hypothetical protein